jgi:pimeloyl-ACP methyl ester carboxylesterase
MEAMLLHDEAARQGIRVIAADRPGFGASDSLAQRRLSDWAEDIATLADALSIDQMGIIGLSGGGPYALACAHRLPHRISTVSLVCSLGSLAQAKNMRAMQWPLQFGFSTASAMPWMSNIWLGGLTQPFARYHPEAVFMMLLAAAPTVDQKVLSLPWVRRAVIASISESLRYGAAGASRDLALYTHAWDFDPASIKQMVHLWHSQADHIVPIEHGRWLASILPHCAYHEFDNEGHYSLWINQMDAILATAAADAA